jgi:hypothetical protein
MKNSNCRLIDDSQMERYICPVLQILYLLPLLLYNATVIVGTLQVLFLHF